MASKKYLWLVNFLKPPAIYQGLKVNQTEFKTYKFSWQKQDEKQNLCAPQPSKALNTVWNYKMHLYISIYISSLYIFPAHLHHDCRRTNKRKWLREGIHTNGNFAVVFLFHALMLPPEGLKHLPHLWHSSLTSNQPPGETTIDIKGHKHQASHPSRSSRCAWVLTNILRMSKQLASVILFMLSSVYRQLNWQNVHEMNFGKQYVAMLSHKEGVFIIMGCNLQIVDATNAWRVYWLLHKAIIINTY